MQKLANAVVSTAGIPRTPTMSFLSQWSIKNASHILQAPYTASNLSPESGPRPRTAKVKAATAIAVATKNKCCKMDRIRQGGFKTFVNQAAEANPI